MRFLRFYPILFRPAPGFSTAHRLHQIVFPAYYEVALKVKYAHDDESVQMLDKIVNSRVFDFGYVYGGWSGVAFMFQGIVGENKSKDFASYYASKGPAAEKYYQDVIDYFNELSQ